MPQMAPISWLALFIIFSLTLLLFNSLNYYAFFPCSPAIKDTQKISSSSLNWKW
uniref:ATP synthase complex subunit 8 n=1 Tax=Niponiella limbatella TaxID=2684672 RepID=A0A6B9P9W0_9NEOP|nr:ATP synthase F0 subunit 8 [Niponiella limbatella]